MQPWREFSYRRRPFFFVARRSIVKDSGVTRPVTGLDDGVVGHAGVRFAWSLSHRTRDFLKIAKI